MVVGRIGFQSQILSTKPEGAAFVDTGNKVSHCSLVVMGVDGMLDCLLTVIVWIGLMEVEALRRKGGWCLQNALVCNFGREEEEKSFQQ